MSTIVMSTIVTSILVAASGALTIVGATVADEQPARKGDWQLVWADEFDGEALDRSRWQFEVDCWGGGNEERQCYTARPENLRISDGVLSIIARKETAAGPALPPRLREGLPEEEANKLKAQPFTSARINTKGKGDWLYGRFEVRAKAPTGQGTWAAVWMLPTEDYYGSWALSGEIDIMEAANLGASCPSCEGGKKDLIYGTIHYGGEWPRNVFTGKDTKLPPTEDGFNTFAVEWTENAITWFVDDQPYQTLTPKTWGPKEIFSKKPKTAPFDRPFYLIMNLAIGGHLAENNNDGGIDLEGYPKSFEIDWVRVYQRPQDIAATAAILSEVVAE
jgi:beta-glucanase (GH16 family)